MRSHLRFLTTPTADTQGTTLLLHFDNKRYLIGSIAEGTQRAAVQQGARLLKVSEIFITGRTEWDNVGGLLGMILTLADSIASSASSSKEDLKKKFIAKLKRENKEHINEDEIARQVAQEIKDKTSLRIFGPPNLNYLLATARRFVFRKGMPLNIQEFGQYNPTAHSLLQDPTQESTPTWSDENVNVWALPILPTSARSILPTGSVSPRKRSYDELNDLATENVPSSTEREQTVMMTKSIVSNMFDSTWRLDALVETPIHEVKLPATLFVKDETTGRPIKYTGPMPGDKEPVPNINVLVRRPWPGALVESLPPTQPAQEAISYIFKNHRQRGKFQPQRATELQVEKGRKWAQLSQGESVLNANGETITPDMVLTEGKDGGAAAIIDLPSADYVEALVNRPEWKQKGVMSGLGAFVWILGPGVAASPLLQQFISEMKEMKHVISSPDLCSNRLSMDSAAAATARLMNVDPARYGVPVHNSTASFHASNGSSDEILADRGMMIQLEPSVEVQDTEVTPILDFDQVFSSMSPEVLQAASDAQDDIRKSKPDLDAWANKLPQKDAEIITLGTGSACPSKYRNVSATLLRVPGWGSVLLDCGENTLGQLRRVYTDNEFNEVLHDLRAIWISHMHADHHLGTASVVKAWYKAVHGSKPAQNSSPASPSFFPGRAFESQKLLAVISGAPMLQWLQEYSNVEDYGYSRVAPLVITPAYTHKNTPSGLSWFCSLSEVDLIKEDAYEAPSDRVSRLAVSSSMFGLSDIQAVLVTHCHGARAVSITFPSGFKASYSGDCRPSKAFSNIGKGSTVCIHEATFDDELQGDAEAKNHTTTSEALRVALAMDAKACVLTHFSQRYQKVPVLEYTDDENDAISPGDDLVADDAPSAEAEDAPMTDATATTDAASQTTQQSAVEESKQTTIKLKKGTDMKVCVAFDLMRVKVGEIAQMEKMTPALIKLFAEDEKKEQAAGGAGDEATADGYADASVKNGGKGKGKNKQQFNAGGASSADGEANGGGGKKQKTAKSKRNN